MKINKWTVGLAAVGLVSVPASGLADEAAKMSPVLTALTPTSISGYVNTSIEWNPGTGNANVPGFAFNKGKQDGFNLDVVKLAIAKPLDESQWAAGYNVELLFGPDANALATGSSLNTAANSTGGGPNAPLANNSDFGIKSAYVALRAPVGNGLDFKVGVWDTIIGYETFDAGSNPNYTRSYGYTIEPTTHTGVLMSYQLCKFASVSGGIANTFGPAINARANGPKAESYKTYLASAALTAPDDWGFLSGSMLYAGLINGFNSGITADQTSYYLGATLNTPVKNLKIGASFDYLGTTDEFAETRGGDRTLFANAVGVYASFQATEKMSLHGRLEYASTDSALLGGLDKVFDATATLQYDLWANVVSRLEVRWDHADGNSNAYGGNLADATPAAGKGDYFTVALNLIYKF